MSTITIFQEINATPEKIFLYLTQQELLTRWLTPSVIAFPKKGTFAAFALGNDINFKVEIEELIDNDLVQWKCIDGNVEWVGSKISFKLKVQNGSSTIVQFLQTNFPESGNLDKWKNNWQFYLETLNSMVQQ